MKINPTELYEVLKQAQIQVVFTKLDGSERTLHCTLQDAFLPEDQRPKQAQAAEKTIVENVTHFNVWDLDEQAWRSFRLDSIKSVKIAGVTYSPTKSKLKG